MSAIKLSFSTDLSFCDPKDNPVLIVGQVKHLSLLSFDDVRCKLEPRVNEEIFTSAIASLHPSPTDTCPLYLNLASVAALPLKQSRHNTPSRGHALTRLVRSCSVGVSESIVIICKRSDVFASACAVARAFPLYSKKTNVKTNTADTADEIHVRVEFLIVPSADDGDTRWMSLSISELQLLEYACDGVRLAARLVDMPCNELNVDDFIQEAKTVHARLNLPVNALTIIRGEQLKERGMGGIYGVGKAATAPPALVVLSYEPSGAATTIAWVGKGIVFDTGGLSIKAKTTMPGMKRDCGGAAAILGAFYTAVKSNFTQNLHCVLCLAENSVSSSSTRPDDIHTLYSGCTVEINNTDAEGRLVLADGVVYAQRDLQAEVIVDVATLTGAQGMATGKFHAAILSNDEYWEQATVSAGIISGDLTFPIPYAPELHFSEYTSAVADMKNSVADRSNAQPSCAGLFIAAHLGFDFPGVWLHVDMASPVHSGERATGYGVALLAALFGKFTQSKLLQEISPQLEANHEQFSKKMRKS